MKINGITITTPGSYDWEDNSVSTDDTGRTEDGTMKILMITQKRKIPCAWRHLTQAEAVTLLNIIKPDYFGPIGASYTPLSIEYSDPKNGTVTGDFYCTTLKAKGLKMDPSSKAVTNWVDITANLIEI
jgi:hypothetical protein